MTLLFVEAGVRWQTLTETTTTKKDLGAVFDAHVKAEFVDKDVAATMATMTPEPYLTHVPNVTGGTGRAEVERFYREHFVGHWPDDLQVKSISRTAGQNRVIDELIVSFTHDREMRVFLPDVAPTGRKVAPAYVVVMGFDETGHCLYKSGCLTQICFLFAAPSKSADCLIPISLLTS